MDLALIALALVGGGFVLEIYSATLGTLGHQDEYGFHLGFEAYHHAEG